MEKLAILGGAPAVRTDPGDIFKWPIITEEDETAALDVLRRGAMSGTDVTVEFERDFAEWHEREVCARPQHRHGLTAHGDVRVRAGRGRRDHLPEHDLLGVRATGHEPRRHHRLRRHGPGDADARSR